MKNQIEKVKNLKRVLSAGLACLLWAGAVYAEPEHMAIQSPKGSAEKQLAKQNLKSVNLQKIQDPEARKAVQEILRYLNLNQTSKVNN